jgi:uncharacterized lipoprotein YmbA
MKLLIIPIVVILTGCASTSKDQLYYEAAKSISKDNTMGQTACWAVIGEIAKGGSEAAKVGAIALAEKCKSNSVTIEAPKKSWLGF